MAGASSISPCGVEAPSNETGFDGVLAHTKTTGGSVGLPVRTATAAGSVTVAISATRWLRLVSKLLVADQNEHRPHQIFDRHALQRIRLPQAPLRKPTGGRTSVTVGEAPLANPIYSTLILAPSYPRLRRRRAFAKTPR